MIHRIVLLLLILLAGLGAAEAEVPGPPEPETDTPSPPASASETPERRDPFDMSPPGEAETEAEAEAETEAETEAAEPARDRRPSTLPPLSRDPSQVPLPPLGLGAVIRDEAGEGAICLLVRDASGDQGRWLVLRHGEAFTLQWRGPTHAGGGESRMHQRQATIVALRRAGADLQFDDGRLVRLGVVAVERRRP